MKLPFLKRKKNSLRFYFVIPFLDTFFQVK